MGERRVDPEQWQRDVDEGERRRLDRRVAERRRRDRLGRFVERAALLAMVVIMSVGWTRYDQQQHSLNHLVQQQRQGRVVAIEALCGAVSGIIDAGRATLLENPVARGAFERNLEGLGLPPRARRHAAAEAAAEAYGQAIAHRVERITRHRGLTLPNGSLDCARLKTASHATP